MVNCLITYNLKAIIYTEYGGPEVLHLMEVDKPVPKDNEVLVKVLAVSINDWDWGLLKGETFIDRMMSGFVKPKYQILGSDIAGRIESIGKNVSRFTIGDEVFGDLSGRWGGFAEYVCAKEDALALKPNAMSFEEAAAIPQAGMLAVQGLLDKGKLQQGEKLLINGAGGGVGTLGLQIAKLYGAEVTVVDHADKLDLLKSLGADHVIDYTKDDFTRNGRHYDLILDTKTNRSFSEYVRVLTHNGRYVIVGGNIGRLLQTFLASPFISLVTKKKIIVVALKPNKDLAYMSELYSSGKIKPLIDGNYTLEETPKAFARFAKAEHKGKLVISLG